MVFEYIKNYYVYFKWVDFICELHLNEVVIK